MFSFIIEILRLLSWAKLWNASRVWASYWVSRLGGRLVLWGQPISLSVEPTSACNLACPQCPTGTASILRPKGRMQTQLLRKSLYELGPRLFNVLFFLQGEPFLNPELPALIAMARQAGVFTMTSTNGHFLTQTTVEKLLDAGLHRLIVSIDGATQASYERYRVGGHLPTVLLGLERLQAAKRERRSWFPLVEIQFIVFRHNEHEIPHMRRLARRLGARLCLKTAQIYDLQQAHELVPRQKRYARYRLNAQGQWEIKSKLGPHCWRIWSAAVLSWEGQLMPCCFDKDGEYPLGNAAKEALPELWRGASFGHFRSRVLRARAQVPICRNCTEGLRPEW